MTDDQLALFAETVFEHEPLPADWPATYWIITAWAPTGESWSAERNQTADAALEASLRAAGHRLLRMTGCSPDRRHREPGWAVALEQGAALRLGREFGQVALFLVRRSRLIVVDCTGGREHPLDRGLDPDRIRGGHPEAGGLRPWRRTRSRQLIRPAAARAIRESRSGAHRWIRPVRAGRIRT